jgi:hypothetical protein
MRIYYQKKKTNLLNIYTAINRSSFLKYGILNLYDFVLFGIQIPLVLQVYTAGCRQVSRVLNRITGMNGTKPFFFCQYSESIHLPLFE